MLYLRTKFAIAIIMVVVLLSVAPLPSKAQDPLTETFTTSNGTFSVEYPADWAVVEADDAILITNNEAAIQQGPGDGEFVALLLLPPDLDDLLINFGIDSGFGANVVGNLLISVVESGFDVTYDSQEFLTIGEKSAVRYDFISTDYDYLSLLLVDAQPQVVIGMVIFANGNTDFMPSLNAVAQTMSYAPDPSAAPTTEIVWHVQEPISTESDEFGELGGLSVASDDTIYVAGGTRGIFVIDPADGSVIDTFDIINPSTDENATIVDVAVGGDDVLWAIDNISGTVYMLDTTEGNLGDILLTFEGDFEPGSPSQIAFDPNSTQNNIYLFATTSNDGEFRGEIQVWNGAGELVDQFFTTLDEDVEAGLPRYAANTSMAIGPDGNIYLMDLFGDARVFATDGTRIEDYPFLVRAANTTALYVDDAGDLYFASLNGQIYRFDNDANFVSTFGEKFGEQGAFEAGLFFAPTGIAVLSDGDVIVIDHNLEYSQIVRISE